MTFLHSGSIAPRLPVDPWADYAPSAETARAAALEARQRAVLDRMTPRARLALWCVYGPHRCPGEVVAAMVAAGVRGVTPGLARLALGTPTALRCARAAGGGVDAALVAAGRAAVRAAAREARAWLREAEAEWRRAQRVTDVTARSRSWDYGVE